MPEDKPPGAYHGWSKIPLYAANLTNSALPTETPIRVPSGDYTGEYRPQVHFTAPKNWMNDPNGLFRDAQGTWHLYYQFDPFHVDGGNIHWGHATSKDLFHWENHPIALSPPEGASIYSGSAVIDVNNTSGFFPDQDDGVVAIYTLHTDEIESQEIAYSRDGGTTFEFYDGNPVIPSVHKDFRDPQVSWYKDHWVMVVSYAADNIIGFFTSPDLKNWTSTSNITIDHGAATKLECPNLVKLPVQDDDYDKEAGGRGNVIGHKYMLAFGFGSNGSPYNGSTIHYYIGDFDGETFTPDDDDEKVRYLDWTKDNYAAQFYHGLDEDEDGIMFGWAISIEYMLSLPTSREGWRGSQTLPRSVHLTRSRSPSNKFNVVSNPCDLKPVLDKRLGHKRVGCNDHFAVDYSHVPSNAVVLDLTLKDCHSVSDKAAVNITFSNPDTGEHFRAGYNFANGGNKVTLFADRSALHGAEDADPPFAPDFFSISDDDDEMSKIRRLKIVVDRSIADIFDMDGKHAGTMLYFATKPLVHLKVETVDLDREAQVEAELWSLNSIWNDGRVNKL